MISQDRQPVVYAAQMGKKCIVVVDGQEQKQYNAVMLTKKE